jgi:hypothetical protein
MRANRGERERVGVGDDTLVYWRRRLASKRHEGDTTSRELGAPTRSEMNDSKAVVSATLESNPASLRRVAQCFIAEDLHEAAAAP